jgi:glycine oxidase
MTVPDTIVIGGGVIGCAIAWRLARAGVRVLVLERAIPGAEASSAAAGILAAQEESHGPGPMAELFLASRARFPTVAAELREETGLDIAHRETGLIAAALDEAEAAALDARYAWQRDAGLRLAWLRGAELRDAEPGLGPAVIAGLSFPDDGQLEPRAYLRALSLAAAAAGARFSSGAYVRRVLHEGGRVTGVELEGEVHRAERVIVAAGSWSSLVDGAALPSRAVRPVRGQIAQLETRPPLIRGTVTTSGGYVVGRADGRVLAGSTMELVGFDKRVTAGGLRHVLEVATRLAPALAEAAFTDSWANFRPRTGDELPLIGPAGPDGLILATGHFRNGILLSAITADLVCELVTGGRASRDLGPFSPARLAP